jgi:hypothetical protein
MKGEFTGELTITSIDKTCKKWKLEHDVSFDIGYKGSGRTILVPKGSITDGATTSVFRGIYPAWSVYSRAAVIHDYLCDLKKDGTPHPLAPKYTDIDYVLWEAAIAVGTNRFNAFIIWCAVSVYHYVRYGLDKA